MIYEHYTIGGELYHHGILGQKWGDRNGPPYPLGSGDHSASEKKAGWKKSLKTKKSSNETINKILTEKEMREKINKDFPTLKDFADIPLEDMEMYWQNEVECQVDLTPEEFKKRYPITYSDLQKEIETKSGDWYNSKGVTEEFQENRNENRKTIERMRELVSDPEYLFEYTKDNKLARAKNYTRYKKEYDKLKEEHKKLDDDLLGIVLKDLGYEDTKRNRAWIKPVVIWD